MNKKYLLVFIGVIVLFGLVFVFIANQQNPQPPSVSTAQNQKPESANRTTQKISQKNLPSLTGTAQKAARQFYNYYFATPENPLAAGKYKTNPYLSEYFKGNIQTGFDNGNIPIFCPQNRKSIITVGKDVQVYQDNQYMTLETISEASPGSKDLYTILLSNKNGQWLVEDVNCL